MHGVVTVVLGVSGLLALVSFLPLLASRLQVPYTVLLAAVGLVLGWVMETPALAGLWGVAGDFIEALATLDLSSDTLLHVFLPILLFETALAVEVRRLLDDIGPILLLAVVAVLVCTCAVGYALAAVSGIDLTVCLLLGSVLATTDPAAVAGVFRDIGAPRRLTVLVEGESLLNDAAAIALFTLLLGMLTSKTESGGGDALLAFLRSFGGGMLVGWLCGRLACFLVTPVRDQPAAEITLTVALAYLSYLLAEHYGSVSGVVSVVAAALTVGSVGRTRISPATWGAMMHVWRQIGFWANSLIVLFTAMLVPQLSRRIGVHDAGLILVAVGAALAARAVVLFGLLPLLSALGLGQRVSHAYKAVMLWGGLRGAVSLTLALAVTENERIPDRAQSFVWEVATGFVLFTLFVNGTTLRWLIRVLRLDRLSPVERAMRNRALALSLEALREKVAVVSRDYQLDESAAQSLSAYYGERLDAIDRERRSEAPLGEADRVTIGLVILINREEELYYKHFKEGIISRVIAELLASRSGRLLDAVKTQGRDGYKLAARTFLDFSSWMWAASWLHRRFGLQGPLARRLARRFEMLVASRMILKELQSFSRERLAHMLGMGIAHELEGLLAGRLAQTEQGLAALKLQYPDYAVVLQSQVLGRAALRKEEADYRTLHAESVISQEVLHDLERDLEMRRRQLDTPPTLDLRLNIQEMVARVPIFAGLAADRVSDIARLLKPRLALPGEFIVRRGERGDCMFFITSGAVEVIVPGLEHPIQLGTGDFFGEMALLTHQPRNAHVRALGYCQLLVLDERDFKHLLQRDPTLDVHIRAVAASRQRQGRAAPAPALASPAVSAT
jgi:CPA1 family monovalent cation:H+ antiporter